MTAQVRRFETGATRDLDETKLDYEGFLSPLVLERYAQYMHANRRQRDGSLRDSDNWQKGIPPAVYMKSGWRHFIAWWREHRGAMTDEGLEDNLCGLLFNAQGYLHETLKARAKVERECYETPIPHDLAAAMLRDGVVPSPWPMNCIPDPARCAVIPPDGAQGYNPPPNCEGHHGHEAPMPPAVLERLDGREDDEGEAVPGYPPTTGESE